MSLAAKLQIKPGQRIRLVNAPRDFSLDAETTSTGKSDGVLVFVKNSRELAAHERIVVANAREDRLSWVAYPKARQLETDLSRDSLWQLLEAAGVRPVRQVSIDSIWSALRFRPA